MTPGVEAVDGAATGAAAAVAGGAGSPARSVVSARARARGLHTVDELKVAVLRQRRTWWMGHAYHCPLCDVDFIDSGLAAQHVVLEQHPVLRMD